MSVRPFSRVIVAPSARFTLYTGSGSVVDVYGCHRSVSYTHLKIHNARSGAEAVGRQVVQAPMPGVILKTYVKKGDSVKRGDPLCVLVAMKMENEIRAVTDGVVKEVFIEDNMKVGLNDRIMVIE